MEGWGLNEPVRRSVVMACCDYAHAYQRQRRGDPSIAYIVLPCESITNVLIQFLAENCIRIY